MVYKQLSSIKIIMKYTAIVIGILLLCYSLWLQVDFESYIKKHQYKYRILGIQDRINYTPAILFAFGVNILGQYKDDGLVSQAVSYLGKFNGHQLKDAYLAHCYYDEEIKLKISYRDSSIVQKLRH